MTGAAPLIQIRSVSKRYPGVIALDGVDLDIPAGRVLGLVGKNGAGKSTLIKVLGGAVSPDEGEVHIDGRHVAIRNPHHSTQLGIAVVHQELADIPNLSVAENVELGLGYPRTAGIFFNRGALRRKTKAVLERIGAEAAPAALQSSLSLAQRRLVMIARGLAADARLLILDEPTASLTDEEIRHLHETLRRLAADGVAVIYVSHRLAEISAVTDDVTVMRDGHVVFNAATADVTSRRLVDEITGTTGAGSGAGVSAAAVADGAEELLRVTGLTSPGAVEGASFTLRRGEILGIAGLVGAGRTELMRLVYGADRATAGTIAVKGVPARIHTPRDAMRNGIVLLPEDRRHQGTVQSFSVRENVTLPGLSRFRATAGLPVPSKRRERAETAMLIDRLQIKVPGPEQAVRTLSGGNQQKVVLAKWMGSGADVFIFDEPTHGIDVEGKDDVYAVMRELAEAGKGVIFISSEFFELVGICSRVLIMREGRLTGELEGDEVTETALVELCYAH
jgi:ABC-type sugar transport system ATPase subunit